MKCPKCNSEIPNDSMFCEQCGAKLVNEHCERDGVANALCVRLAH